MIILENTDITINAESVNLTELIEYIKTTPIIELYITNCEIDLTPIHGITIDYLIVVNVSMLKYAIKYFNVITFKIFVSYPDEFHYIRKIQIPGIIDFEANKTITEDDFADHHKYVTSSGYNKCNHILHKLYHLKIIYYNNKQYVDILTSNDCKATHLTTSFIRDVPEILQHNTSLTYLKLAPYYNGTDGSNLDIIYKSIFGLLPPNITTFSMYYYDINIDLLLKNTTLTTLHINGNIQISQTLVEENYTLTTLTHNRKNIYCDITDRNKKLIEDRRFKRTKSAAY